MAYLAALSDKNELGYADFGLNRILLSIFASNNQYLGYLSFQSVILNILLTFCTLFVLDFAFLVISCLYLISIVCIIEITNQLMCRSGKEGSMLPCQTLLQLLFVVVFGIWLSVRLKLTRKQIVLLLSR